jgi:hypothetical protein
VHQLTYAGRPLYAFAGDASPGAASGQGSMFGGQLNRVLPAGPDPVLPQWPGVGSRQSAASSRRFVFASSTSSSPPPDRIVLVA